MTRLTESLEAPIDCALLQKLVCDNQSMTKKAALRPNREKIYPNSTMEAEWDILAEIWETLEQLERSRPISITWIKGHQDDTTQKDNLSLPAQLNIEADELADQYIQNHPDHPYHQVPLLPTSGINLNLRHGTVTFKHKRELRLASTAPHMQRYMLEKYEWDEATFDNIDWEAHRLALNRNNKHRCIMVKHLHRMVPVGRRVHRYDRKYPDTCPSCSLYPLPEETEEHLYQCTAPSRIEWRAQCLKQIRTTMDAKDTPVPVMELLLEGIKSVFDNRQPDSIQYDQSVHHIKIAQDSIGWSHVLKG